jgi:hypothetical protein
MPEPSLAKLLSEPDETQSVSLEIVHASSPYNPQQVKSTCAKERVQNLVSKLRATHQHLLAADITELLAQYNRAHPLWFSGNHQAFIAEPSAYKHVFTLPGNNSAEVIVRSRWLHPKTFEKQARTLCSVFGVLHQDSTNNNPQIDLRAVLIMPDEGAQTYRWKQGQISYDFFRRQTV